MNDRETLEYFNTEKTKRFMYRDIYTEEGKAEEKQAIAKKMIDKKESTKYISEITGLSKEEISTLKKLTYSI